MVFLPLEINSNFLRQILIIAHTVGLYQTTEYSCVPNRRNLLWFQTTACLLQGCPQITQNCTGLLGSSSDPLKKLLYGFTKSLCYWLLGLGVAHPKHAGVNEYGATQKWEVTGNRGNSYKILISGESGVAKPEDLPA